MLLHCRVGNTEREVCRLHRSCGVDSSANTELERWALRNGSRGRQSGNNRRRYRCHRCSKHPARQVCEAHRCAWAGGATGNSG